MPAPNGFVPTPDPVADFTAATTFGVERPSEVKGQGRLLLPGLGTGNLYDAVLRYCTQGENWYVPEFSYDAPHCIGVENDPKRVSAFRDQHQNADINVIETDFLLDPPKAPFDWVLANPPFLRYKEIPETKRDAYRERFNLVEGQFPLYVPFFEQALRLLKPGGWLTFILPFSALTTRVAEPLREAIRMNYTGGIRYLPKETFEEKVETILLNLKKERYTEGDYLWLEEMYGYEIRPILKKLDVDDVDLAVNEYYDQFKTKQTLVRNRDRRERCQRDKDGCQLSRQAGLEEYSQT